MTPRFTVEFINDKFRVFDSGTLTKGKFHTLLQASMWIDTQLAKATYVPQTGMRGRARAALITPNVSATIAQMGLPEAGQRESIEYCEAHVPEPGEMLHAY